MRAIPMLWGGWGHERGQYPALGPSLARRGNTPHLVARSVLHPPTRVLEEGTVRTRLLLRRRGAATGLGRIASEPMARLRRLM